MTAMTPLHDEQAVRAALREAGSISGAARLLGVSRQTVHKYVKRYGIEVAPPVREVAA
jgi:transcriptional regulator of acetoin/glycerol metabolism